jgi:hypothetical protein
VRQLLLDKRSLVGGVRAAGLGSVPLHLLLIKRFAAVGFVLTGLKQVGSTEGKMGEESAYAAGYT